ncbi:hypothetical protein AB0387_19795 [Streptomyces sp. NPDC089173]|uniref:hypothetical protein n=1 Tax=Streptomyces sp. NPDC089173 TaxID=3154965 RepID=UPI00344B89EC
MTDWARKHQPLYGKERLDYSPVLGKPLADNRYHWVLRPQEQAADQDVIEWLDVRADKWIKNKGEPV